MSNLSLDASIRTCKVYTGQANRTESDRFLNPENMVCIPWNGYNNKGQSVCADSWYTKTPGCNYATDRVTVENHLRPQYSNYIQLDIDGIQGNLYGNMDADESLYATRYEKSRNCITGNFGGQFGATNEPSCKGNAYDHAMAQEAQNKRQQVFNQSAYQSQNLRNYSGNKNVKACHLAPLKKKRGCSTC